MKTTDAEWWSANGKEFIVVGYDERGLCLMTRQAMHELLTAAGYTETTAPDIHPCTATLDCQAEDNHKMCCPSPRRRPPLPADRPLLPDPVIPSD